MCIRDRCNGGNFNWYDRGNSGACGLSEMEPQTFFVIFNIIEAKNSEAYSFGVFYTIFYFPNNKYIATFVSAFGQGFVFLVENIRQNHVPYNKIIKLKNDGAKPAYKFIRNETLYIDTAIFREKVCTLFRTFLYPYLHCSNHRKFV